VIAGDNLQVAAFQSNSTYARSNYLQALFANGANIENFGSLVAPLGVQFVLLSKTVDWSNYLWLTKQSDLKLIMNTTDLEVWENLSYKGVGARYSSLASVKGLGQLEAKATLSAGDFAPYVISNAAQKGKAPPTRDGSVTQSSLVQYHVPRGRPGWVEIDALYEPGWKDGSGEVRSSAEGTVLVKVGSASSTISFTPLRLVEVGYAISGLVIGLLLFAFVWISSSPRRRSRRSKDESTRS
jgi:hypothetical protein